VPCHVRNGTVLERALSDAIANSASGGQLEEAATKRLWYAIACPCSLAPDHKRSVVAELNTERAQEIFGCLADLINVRVEIAWSLVTEADGNLAILELVREEP
jgi:hypothetical protein